MKKSDKQAAIYGGIILFFTVFVTVTLSVVIFKLVSDATDDTFLITLTVLGVILLITFACTMIDFVRRKITVEKPVSKILEATEQIAKGDFSVRLAITHTYDKYNVYDYIKENINKMAEELSKSEILKNDFISNVSHELKTPLSLIQNYTALMKKERISEEKKAEYADIVLKSTKRLADLVENVLKLNKLENSTLSVPYRSFSLSDTLGEVVLRFEEEIERKNIQLNCDIDELSVYSSESYIEIILSNLVSNAVKFTDIGGQIDISLKKSEKDAVVTVRDSGCGISAEQGERIFDKFYQADTSHSVAGNGLGLALVKKVIDVLGGTISVSSEVGVGSTFCVRLSGVVDE